MQQMVIRPSRLSTPQQKARPSNYPGKKVKKPDRISGTNNLQKFFNSEKSKIVSNLSRARSRSNSLDLNNDHPIGVNLIPEPLGFTKPKQTSSLKKSKGIAGIFTPT